MLTNEDRLTSNEALERYTKATEIQDAGNGVWKGKHFIAGIVCIILGFDIILSAGATLTSGRTIGHKGWI